MNDSIPLNQAESQDLEFKGKDVLKHLPSVSREVVGMLNATGGDLWIGLGEENGRAVRIEAIENSDREVGRLRDHFCDSIEPSPRSGEIDVKPIPVENAGSILRVRVRPMKDRVPYALREGTARHFIKRVQDRLRPMSREELFRPPSGADSDMQKARQKVQDARDRQKSNGSLWLRIQPVGNTELTITKGFRDYFTNPQRTGNRIAGWNFVDPYSQIEQDQNGIRYKYGGERDVRVFRDGAIEFSTPIANLYWKSVAGVREAHAKEIWPYTLLEFPVSVFRLASTIYKEHKFEVETFIADLSLFGIRGWSLRPHSPVSIGYMLSNGKPFDADEIVWADPLTFPLQQMIEEPDRCAFRLVIRVYQAFGLYEEDLPAEFNRDAGKLVLS
jgi:hypothetical protein